MKYIISIFILFGALGLDAQSIEVLKYDDLSAKWFKNNDTTYVVNYWATWCGPCVKELPDFLRLAEEMQDEKFKMILVSLDFPSQIKSRLIPFIEKRKIKPEVVVLKDDPNVWINQVDENWEGDIPVTQIIKNEQVDFYGGEMNYEDLKQAINKLNTKTKDNEKD